MNRRSVPLVLVACLFAALLAWPGRAQDSGQSNAPAFKLINIDFPGGSAVDYLNAVRKAAGEANIVAMADISSVSVPAIKLRNVNIGSALQILETVPRDQPDKRVDIKVIRGETGMPGQMQVFTVEAKIVSVKRPEGQDSLVISISDVLDQKIKADDVLTAIQTSLEMLKGDFPQAQIRFHDATGLLIARGHPEQMSSIQHVVQQLRERKERAKLESERSMHEAIEQLRDQLKATEAKLTDATRQAVEMTTRNEMLQKELDRMGKAVQDQEARMRQLNIELTAAHQQLDQGKPRQ